MLVSLIIKEIVSNILSLRFMVTFVLFIVVIQASIFVLSEEYARALAGFEAGRSEHQSAIDYLYSESKDEQEFNRRFHDEILYGDGSYHGRTPGSLSMFALGLERKLPTQVNVWLNGARKINEGFYRNPLLALFATPDFVYVVNIVVSLLAVLFVFDTICGEKERGTMKVVLANSVPRDLVLLGKWIGGFASLVAPFLVAVFGGITYVYLSGSFQLIGDAGERLIWILAVSLLYISLFFALGLMISTLTHKASTALLVSLFAWICWILVIPNLTPVFARVLSPVPSTQKIRAEKASIDRETGLRMNRLSASMYFFGTKKQEARNKVREEGEHQKRKLDQYYRERLQQQIDLSKMLSRLSPSASYTYAATGLASTGVDQYDRFRSAYSRFRSDYDRWGEDWVDRFRRGEGLAPRWFQNEVIPGLTMVPARVDDAIDEVMIDILVIIVLNVLFLMLSYLFFLRYDVT